LTPDSQAGPVIPVSAATSDVVGSGARAVAEAGPDPRAADWALGEAGDAAVPVRTRFPDGVVARDHRSSSAT
jgi:hypothetical protein